MDRLNDAFDSIRASDELRSSASKYVAKHRRQSRQIYRMASAAACAALILLSSFWVYFTPTAHISIEINPSVELDINRFDRVISASGSNEDGQVIVENLNLVHLSYTEAVDRILTEDAVAQLVNAGEILSVGIIAPEGDQSQRLLTDTQSCTSENPDAQCYHAEPETAEQARDHGLPCSKYRALLELQALDPGITADDIRDLSMRQIRDWIADLTRPEPDPPTNPSEDPAAEPTEPTTPAHNGQGNGRGNGQGNGQSNGQGNGQGQGNGHGSGQGHEKKGQ